MKTKWQKKFGIVAVILIACVMGIVMTLQSISAAEVLTTPEPTNTSQSCYNNWIYDVAFSPDGQSVLTTWEPGQIRLWKTDTGELLRTFEHSNQGIALALTLAFSPEGNEILTGGNTQAILWNVDTGIKLHEFHRDTKDSYGTSVVFTSDGKYAVTGGGDGASIWDVQSGEKLHSFTGVMDQGIGQFIRISSNGRYIVTTNIDEQKVYIWSVETGEKLHTFDNTINAILSPDSRYIMTFSYNQSLVLWDLKTFQAIQSFDIQGAKLYHWEFSSDGQYLLVAIDNQFTLWKVQMGERLLQFPLPLLENAYGFLPDSKHLLMPQTPSEANKNQNHIMDLWDIGSRTVITSFSMGDNSVSAFDFSSDSRYIILGTLQGNVELWDIQRGEEIREFC
jgi:WD40 repeat protein